MRLFNKISSRLKSSKFIRQVITVAGGTIVAQAVVLVFSPIITRLYGPESFGLLSAFTSIALIIAPIAGLALPFAIVLPKRHVDAYQIAVISLISTAAIAGGMAIFIWIYGPAVLYTLGLDDVIAFGAYIPLVLLFTGVLQTLQQLMFRHHRFKEIAVSSVLQAATVGIVQVALGVISGTPGALIGTYSFGKGLHAGTLLVISKKHRLVQQLRRTAASMSVNSVRTITAQYRDFPRYRAPELLVSAASQGLPIIFLTALFGPQAAGYYALCRTTLAAPVQLIGSSVGNVFYPKIANDVNQNRPIWPSLARASNGLAVIGFVPFSVIILAGPWIFSLVFGSEWREAGEYARWVGLWHFTLLVNRPAVQAMQALGAQRGQLVVAIIMAVVRVGVLGAGYLTGINAVTSVALLGLASTFGNVVLFTYVRQLAKRHDRQIVSR